MSQDKMTAANDFLANVLKCPRCEGDCLTISHDKAVCNVCSAQFPIMNGVPILYEEGCSNSKLQYCSTPRGITDPRSKFRLALRSMKVEALVQSIWNAYLLMDSKVSPMSPATVNYWMDRVCSSLPDPPLTILDFGGGSGLYRDVVASPEDRYVALEVDYHSYFVQKNLHRHQYIIGDGTRDIFREGSFSIIILFDVMEHLSDPFGAVRNCAKWLKPGGLLLVAVPQYWHLHGWPNDYFRYTIYGLEEIARRAGLAIVDSWPMGGACVLIWTAIEINFSLFWRLPIIKQTLAAAMLLTARLFDFLLDLIKPNRRHPDTRGWMAIIRKPLE
ncbi:MAG: methyltransferase domain-containing protein [Desulfomonilaceae bacterium]